MIENQSFDEWKFNCNKIALVYLKFIMLEAKYQTPNRRKSTLDETYTEKRLKFSTV